VSVKSKRHMDRVRGLGCIICRNMGLGDTPASAHHCFDTAMRNDFLTIPLCKEHHQGARGFHGMGEKAFNRVYDTCELKLLAQTLEELAN